MLSLESTGQFSRDKSLDMLHEHACAAFAPVHVQVEADVPFCFLALVFNSNIARVMRHIYQRKREKNCRQHLKLVQMPTPDMRLRIYPQAPSTSHSHNAAEARVCTTDTAPGLLFTRLGSGSKLTKATSFAHLCTLARRPHLRNTWTSTLPVTVADIHASAVLDSQLVFRVFLAIPET